MSSHLISASILAADFSQLGKEVTSVLAAGANSVHFDVMDHHFVPNLSIGSLVCQSLRDFGIKSSIDVHLMVTDPIAYIEPFAKAGANLITFHPETVDDVFEVIQLIKSYNMQAGLAFSPDQPILIDDSVLPYLDLILLMSVSPGFGGQVFIESTYERIQQTRAMMTKKQVSPMLGVDGGVKLTNMRAISDAGADFFVVGSALFGADDYLQQVQMMRSAINVS